MPDDLEERFDAATEGIYSRVLIEAGYRAANYHRMLIGYGGVATAKTLVNFSSVSGGYAALSEIKRLDLTVEALIHDSTRWPRSFSEHEHKRVVKRLKEYKYPPAMSKFLLVPVVSLKLQERVKVR